MSLKYRRVGVPLRHAKGGVGFGFGFCLLRVAFGFVCCLQGVGLGFGCLQGVGIVYSSCASFIGKAAVLAAVGLPPEGGGSGGTGIGSLLRDVTGVMAHLEAVTHPECHLCQ